MTCRRRDFAMIGALMDLIEEIPLKPRGTYISESRPTPRLGRFRLLRECHTLFHAAHFQNCEKLGIAD